MGLGTSAGFSWQLTSGDTITTQCTNDRYEASRGRDSCLSFSDCPKGFPFRKLNSMPGAVHIKMHEGVPLCYIKVPGVPSWDCSEPAPCISQGSFACLQTDTLLSTWKVASCSECPLFVIFIPYQACAGQAAWFVSTLKTLPWNRCGHALL